jgi:hypothetical protein
MALLRTNSVTVLGSDTHLIDVEIDRFSYAASRPAKSRPHSWIWSWKPLLVAAAFLVLYTQIVRPGVDWGDDWALYVAHARNFATGHPYLDTGFLYSRLTAVSSPPSYPPVFPFLLSLVYRVRGFDLEAMKFLSCLAAALAVFLSGCYFRPKLGDRWTLVLMLLLGGTLAFLDTIGQLATHMMGIDLMLICFLVDRAVRDRDWDRRRPLLAAVVLVIPVLIAIFTRASAAPLAAAVVVDDLWRRRRLTLFSAAFSGALAVLFVLISRVFPGGASYGDAWRMVPHLWTHSVYYAKWASYMWFNSFSTPLHFLTFAVCSVAAAAAFYRRVRQGPGIAEFFVVLHLGMLIVYPAGTALYYALPLATLYCAYAIEGMLPLLRNRLLAAAAAAMLLAVPAGNLLHADRSPFPGPGRPEYRVLLDAVRQDTSPGDRFLARKPRLFALLSGRAAGFYVRTGDAQVFWSDVADRRIAYVVWHKGDPEDRQWLEPQLRRFPGRFALRYENPEFALYAVR